MDLQLSPHAVAVLVHRLCAPKLTPIAKAAHRYEGAMKRIFLNAVKEAQDAVPMQELVDVLSLGHPGTGAPLWVLNDVIDMMLEETPREIEHRPYVRAAAGKETVAGVLGKAMTSGAGANELCVVPTGDVAVIDRYVNGGVSDTVNNAFRYDRMTDELADIARQLDAAMKPLVSDMTLFRVSDGAVFSDLKVGDIFTDLGFTSTTKIEKNLAKIAKEVALKPKDRVFFEISVPQGTGAVDVNANLGAAHAYAKQEEIILQRGLRYEVMSVDGGKIKARVLR